MDEPLTTVSHEHSVILRCPVRDDEMLCNIPLPRQSRLGRYEGLEFVPSRNWQENFLCLRHGRVCACSPLNIHLELQVRDPNQPVAPLWHIDATCGHDRCGWVRTIYTAKMPDWSSISERIQAIQPKMACDGHDFVWKKEWMKPTEIAHNSPVR
jgi:hypothetical protein